MAAPQSTFDQFAIDKLLQTPDPIRQMPLTAGSIDFKLPVSDFNIDLPYTHTGQRQSGNPVGDEISKLFRAAPSERFMSSPIYFNADEINAARYMASPDYYKLGISLSGDNEERYGQNQSWGEVFSNAGVGMAKLASNGFIDGWKGWGRMTSALVNWDWSKLHGDAASMLELDNQLKEVMNLNPIYATKEGTETFWNRQTFGNFLQQTGFAVGAGLQMLSEQILTKAIETAITAGTFGAGAGLAAGLETAADANTARNIGRLTQFFQKTKEFYDASKNFKALKKLGDVWKNESLLKNFVTTLGEKIPGVDIAMDISKTYGAGKMAGLSGTKIAGDIARVGIGGVKRTLSEANFAFTEARMEAAGTFSDLYNQMQQEHFKKNGTFAKDEDLQNMQNMAMQAADKNFNFNSAVLAVSNRIMFDNIFKNSKVTSRILSNLGEDVTPNAFRITGKINGRSTIQYYKGTRLGNFKNIAKDFGYKKAATALMKPMLQFEVTEGVQELLQEGSAEFYKDYYMDVYRASLDADVIPDESKSFEEAVGSQLNLQGLKTFMSGALTGMLISGPTYLTQKAFRKIEDVGRDTYETRGMSKEDKEKYFAEKKERNEKDEKHYNEFNAIAKDPSKFFNAAIKNYNLQKEGSVALNEAAKEGDKFAYENIRTDMLQQMIEQSIRNNTHEGLIDTLREYGKSMTKEEFEQAFVGIGYTSKNKKSAADYTNKIADSIEGYVKIKNNLTEKYGGLANPNKYQPGTPEFFKELVKKQTLDNMIDTLASNEFKAADALDRSTRIFSTLSGHKTLGASLATAFNILGSETALNSEIEMLESEIEVKTKQLESADLSRTERAKLKKELKLKEKQYAIVSKWNENKLNITNKAKIGKARAAFKKYLELKNEEAGRSQVINDVEVDDMFYAFNDYIKLNNKAQEHVNAINMLTNPEYFEKIHQKMMAGAEKAYFKMLQEAAEKEIADGKTKPDECFIITVSGRHALFTPDGDIIQVFDDIEEARKAKELLDLALKGEGENDEEKLKEAKEEAEKEAETEKTGEEGEGSKDVTAKLLINNRLATFKLEGTTMYYSFDDEDNKTMYTADIDPKTRKVFDKDGNLLDIKKPDAATTSKTKSIDQQIKELEDAIKALPNNGVIIENGMAVPSPELKDLRAKLEALVKQKDAIENAKKQKVVEIKQKLLKLNEKTLIVDGNFYVNKDNPDEKYNRVSSLKGEYTGPKTDAADRGTIIDTLLRKFIKGELTTIDDLIKDYEENPLSKTTAKFDISIFTDLFDIFTQVKKITENKGIQLISDIPTLWGKINDGDYAGTIDLLGISDDGKVYIIDLKTSSRNRRDESDAYYKTYKDADSIQQSAYAELLRQRTGINVEKILIFPIQIAKKDGNYSSATANKSKTGAFTMEAVIDRTIFPEKSAEEKEEPEEKKEPLTSVNIVKTPSADIINQLNKLSTFQEKLQWLKDNNLLEPIVINGKSYNVIDYNDRVMVLMKIGKYNIPFYISTGQAGKKNVKAGDWYVVFGIGEKGWINKGTEEQINDQYKFPVFQKLAKILNESIGKIETRENNNTGKIKEGIGYLEEEDVNSLRAFNKQMNLPTEPAKTAYDSSAFYAHAKSTLELLDKEIEKINKESSDDDSVSNITDEIEKGRQETIDSIKEGYNGGKTWNYVGQFSSQASKFTDYELFQDEYTKNQVIDKINANYDAEYLDAVNKGEITKQQALEALEKAGRKESDVYKQLSGQTKTNAFKYTDLKEGDQIYVTSKEDGVKGVLIVTQIEKPDFIRYDIDFVDFNEKNIGYSEDDFNNLFTVDYVKPKEEDDTKDDVDQVFDSTQITEANKESVKEFQSGFKQTSPHNSLGNRTHDVKFIEIDKEKGTFAYERGAVNPEYVFDVATPNFNINEPLIFKVITDYSKPYVNRIGKSYKYDEIFDDKGSVKSDMYDNARIGIYKIDDKGNEIYIGAIHTPEWISFRLGNAYPHLAEITDVNEEVNKNRLLRKQIIDHHNANLGKFVYATGKVVDKSMGIINTSKTARPLSDVLNPEIGKGGSENRHGFFTIVRDGFFQTDKGEILNKNQYHQIKTFEDDSMVNYEGYTILMLPTPTGKYFPTFIRLPKLKRAQSEFILEAWKVFKGFSKNDEIVKKVYEAVGSVYSEGLKPDMGLLKLYIKHYYTNLSNKDLSTLGNGADVNPGLARIDIYSDGNLRIQGKLENGEWMDKVIRKPEEVTSDILPHMDNLLTTIRFTDVKNSSLLGINSTDKINILEYQNGKLSVNNTTYNSYIMSGAKTFLEKGVESKNQYNDWVYFSNPVVKFNVDEYKTSVEPDKSLLEPVPETTEKAPSVSENTSDDKAKQLLDLLNNMDLNDDTVDDSMKDCFDI